MDAAARVDEQHFISVMSWQGRLLVRFDPDAEPGRAARWVRKSSPAAPAPEGAWRFGGFGADTMTVWRKTQSFSVPVASPGARTPLGPPTLSHPRLQRNYVLPHWFLLLLTAVPPAVWWRRKRYERRLARLAVGLCPECGYDLRATPDRCPECGAEAKQKELR
jgi:hypothetical protein